MREFLPNVLADLVVNFSDLEVLSKEAKKKTDVNIWFLKMYHILDDSTNTTMGEYLLKIAK